MNFAHTQSTLSSKKYKTSFSSTSYCKTSSQFPIPCKQIQFTSPRNTPIFNQKQMSIKQGHLPAIFPIKRCLLQQKKYCLAMYYPTLHIYSNQDQHPVRKVLRSIAIDCRRSSHSLKISNSLSIVEKMHKKVQKQISIGVG
jgi:hypothetical protein